MLKKDVAIQTNGFQIGNETTTGDNITLGGGTQLFIGNGYLVRGNHSNGAWAIGGGGDATDNVRIQNLNVYVTWNTAALIIFAGGGNYEFYDTIFRGGLGGPNGVGTAGTGMLVRMGWNSNPKAVFYNCTFHKMPGTSNVLLSVYGGICTFIGCTFITQSDAYIEINQGSAHFIGCTFLTPGRTAATPLIQFAYNDGVCTITLEDCTIDCNHSVAIARMPNSTLTHTLNLKGMTAIKGSIDPTGLIINDTRYTPYITDVIFTDISPELNTNVDSYYDTFYKVKVTLISDDYPALISGLTYAVRMDGATEIAKATLTDVNDWITQNAPTGTKYWVRRYIQPNTAVGLGPVQVSSNYYKR